MEDLGPNSDCGESESQTDSETRFVLCRVGDTHMLWSLSWSDCGGISTGTASGQSTSSATCCGKSGALLFLDSPKRCCIKLSDPCVSSETKVSLQGEIKEKGGMEPPESSVQPSMTKTCDIDIVVQGSSVQRETKDNRNVEQESSGQHDQERINDKAVDEKEFLIQEEVKEK